MARFGKDKLQFITIDKIFDGKKFQTSFQKLENEISQSFAKLNLLTHFFSTDRIIPLSDRNRGKSNGANGLPQSF
jgi:hypothetical protein